MRQCELPERPLGPLLGHCAHLTRERMDARLVRYDVTPTQIHVLHYLYHHENQAAQGDVTAHLKVKPSTANGILTRMEERGLLQRTVSGEDGRKRLITLTEKGREKQETLRRKFAEMESVMVAGLSADEVARLHSLLERVMQNLEEDRNT